MHSLLLFVFFIYHEFVPYHIMNHLKITRNGIIYGLPVKISHRWVSTKTASSKPTLETKWRSIWSKNRCRKENDDGEKFCVLAMFPYPSGNLHMGHLRVYTVSDVLARYRRMRGYNVVHAMGWDAFGLPAENAAIERGVNPRVWTLDNIAKMKEQMAEILSDFDWDREVVTCEADYYKWTQKLFLMLYERGLAYRKLSTVNWDPVEKTVLANEQVDAEGRSWRSGAIVEKKKLNQWFLAITKYADDLLKDLDLLEEWPEKVKTMQKNWIGRSEGTRVRFSINDIDGERSTPFIDVFTTRPDTLPGVQYLALSLEHPAVIEKSKTDKGLAEFLSNARNLDQDSKEGYELKGLIANSPLSSYQDNRLPVFVAPYVLSDYGLGAVMGVPAHDERDFNFWQNARSDDAVLKVVVDPSSENERQENLSTSGLYVGKNGILNGNAGNYCGLSSKEASVRITEELELTGNGGPDTQLRLRDWLVSRQRFWGAPIPMIHCNNCGTVPVPETDLPVILPDNIDAKPLASDEKFLNTTCPKCHSTATRDSDTMDTFMDSSWYFFRYTDPKNDKMIFDYEKASKYMPVDLYVGGVEHAILHLLYSRFISKFLVTADAWDGGEYNGEPIKKLVTQGMVHGKTYIEPDTGRFLKPWEVEFIGGEPLIKSTQTKPLISYEKMSKSKYNGADPSECIQRHGADSTRAHILFQAPLPDVLNWEEAKIVGIERWLEKLEILTNKVIDVAKKTSCIKKKDIENKEKNIWNEIQNYLGSITNSFHTQLSMNTVISDYMKLTKAVSNIENEYYFQKAYEILLKVIAPVVPAHAEEFWERYLIAQGQTWKSIFLEDWPEESPFIVNTTQYSVVINGKRRFSFEADIELSGNGSGLLSIAQSHGPHADKWLKGKEITSVIAPKGKNTIIILTKK